MADLARLEELQQFRQARTLTDDELRDEARIHTALGDRAAAVECLKQIGQAAPALDLSERLGELLERRAQDRLSTAGLVELASLLRQAGRADEADEIAGSAMTDYGIQTNLFAPAIEADRIEAELRAQLPWWQGNASPMLLFVVAMGVIFLVMWLANINAEAHF